MTVCQRLQRTQWLSLATLLVLTARGAAEDPPERVIAAERQRIDAVARATSAAVAVFAPGGGGGGSGVVISADGFALSNFHVVKPAGEYMQCSMSDGKLYDAVIVGIDPTGDVALIKLLGRQDFPVANMGDSDKIRVGDWCFAIGNPFLLATDFQPTVSYGIVSGVHRYQPPAGTLLEYADCIQTDAAINPGNSGGPLFDADGRLIGINGRGSFEKRGRVNVGVGYAISINQIKKFLGYLRSGRIVDHATLGATMTTDDQGRVVVSDILDSSDAYRRGLRYGDQLLSFGGRDITTVNGFKNVLGIFPRGWRVPMTFRNEEGKRDVQVRLAGVHSREELIRKLQRSPRRAPGQPPQPKRRPDGPKGRKKIEPQPGPAPKIPGPPMKPPNRKPPPEHAAKLIQKRTGYANYYFNLQNQQRVWSAFTASGSGPVRPGPWVIQGNVAGGGPFEIRLDQTEVRGQFPASRDRVDVRIDLDQQLLPIGSGGLLPALHLWKRLIMVGPKQFGEVYYLGTSPLPDRQGLFDVLVGTHNVVETRFVFSPQTGHLVAVELYPEMQVDPCELYFSDYRKSNEFLLPHRIQIRYGDDVFTELEITKYQLNAKEAEG